LRLIRGFGWLVFVGYVIYAGQLFFLGSYRSHAMERLPVNLVPFRTISGYVHAIGFLNFNIWFDNLFGNILVMMPLGFLLPLLNKKLRKARHTAAIAFWSSVGVECALWLLHVGSMDVDDVILNTLGGLLGYAVYVIIYKLIR
jgi:glycopeptide antibiotics resistance protein